MTPWLEITARITDDAGKVLRPETGMYQMGQKVRVADAEAEKLVSVDGLHGETLFMRTYRATNIEPKPAAVPSPAPAKTTVEMPVTEFIKAIGLFYAITGAGLRPVSMEVSKGGTVVCFELETTPEPLSVHLGSDAKDLAAELAERAAKL